MIFEDLVVDKRDTNSSSVSNKVVCFKAHFLFAATKIKPQTEVEGRQLQKDEM